eukprot:31368-Pelagococcus_subviridis.AAC.6
MHFTTPPPKDNAHRIRRSAIPSKVFVMSGETTVKFICIEITFVTYVRKYFRTCTQLHVEQ